jgi:hypothetical protein
VRTKFDCEANRPRGDEANPLHSASLLQVVVLNRLRVVVKCPACVEVWGIFGVDTQELLEAWFVLHAKERLHARLHAALERFPDPALVTPKGMIVRSLESRWGSMTAAGNLVLNWRLIHASTQCIDYVITHELCHLIHANHGKEFWHLLARVFPEWEKYKNKLESDLY